MFCMLDFHFRCLCGPWLLVHLRPNNVLTLLQCLTVGMLVGQPVVFGILELEVRVAQLALLGSEVFEVLGTVVGVAELILVVHSWAVLAAVGGSEENGATTEKMLQMSVMHLDQRRKETVLTKGCKKKKSSFSAKTEASVSCMTAADVKSRQPTECPALR